MTDDRLREDLNAYLDGELDAEREAELRARLESDADLRREYEALERTVEAVRGIPRVAAPAELLERVRMGAGKPPAPILRRLAPLLATAAALLVAVLVFARPPRTSSLPEEARVPDKEIADLDDAADKREGEMKVTAPEAQPGDKPSEGLVSDAKKESRNKRAPAKDALAEPLPRGGRRGAVERLDEAGADAADDAAPSGKKADEPIAPGAPAAAEQKQKKSVEPKREEVTIGGAKTKEAEAEAKGPARSVVDTVRRGEPLDDKRFAAYVAELGKLERSRLVSHIQSFGISSGPDAGRAGKLKKKRATPDAAAPLAKESEARQVAALLQRAYPALKEPYKKAGSASGGSEAAEEEKAAAKKSGLTASVGARKTATLFVEIEATPSQLRLLRTWLARISTAHRARHAGTMKRFAASGVPPGSEKRQRYRIALTYPKKKKKN